jgi:hypothetical protein
MQKGGGNFTNRFKMVGVDMDDIFELQVTLSRHEREAVAFSSTLSSTNSTQSDQVGATDFMGSAEKLGTTIGPHV